MLQLKKRKSTNFIIIHCSATKANQHVKAATIRKWHVEERGWLDIGYHYVIRRNGILEQGRDKDIPGSHVKGYNKESVGICIVGGLDANGDPEDNFTEIQYKTLLSLVEKLKLDYPSASICGHRDMPDVKKDCPCFDVYAWFYTAFKENAVPSLSGELEGFKEHWES